MWAINMEARMIPTLTQTASGWSFSLPHVTMNGYVTKAKAVKAADDEIAFLNFEGDTIKDRLAALGL
jgi:hypothetical protein